MINILGFLFCATIIFLAGKKLSWYGDLIAEKTGMGKAWVGLILMASVTSLPELIVGISSSAIIQSADLAVGDILGSCTFNLAILAILDIFVPNKQHLFFVASSSRHILSASFGLILISLAGLSIYLPNELILIPGIGIMSVVFLFIYLVSIRTIYQFDLAIKAREGFIEEKKKDLPPLRKLVTYYSLFALITITSALFIPYFAENIAQQTGLGNTFVGTIFVAASTSLPEIAVSIAAVRFGAVDLALGNLLGSNIFNILILSIDDFFYTRGILLKDASDIHLISVFSGIIMTALAIAGLAYRSPQKKLLMAIDSILILLFWVCSVIFLYYVSIT
jgi:cation:H+ antiporter